MEDCKMKEYEILREEISQKIELQNTLLTFTITTSVAASAFALSKNNLLFYLIPFCIIIPMSTRIAYYTSAMAKLSAYMEVFLEGEDGIIWETRNRKLINKRIRQKKKKLFDFTIYQHNECLITSIVSFFLFIYYLVEECNQTIFIKLLAFICATAFLLIEVYITYRMNSFDKDKNKWYNEWKNL